MVPVSWSYYLVDGSLSRGMPTAKQEQVHWDMYGNSHRVNTVQMAEAWVVPPKDGCVLGFGQEGKGEYLIDNVVVMDQGPVGGTQ